MFGVQIEKGLKDWQILQQENGWAELTLEGSFTLPEGASFSCPTVYIRAVWEDSGLPVVSGSPAQMLPGNRWRFSGKIPAGGLYRVESCLADGECRSFEWQCRGDMIHHVGAGDLFVIAGQSNSAGYGREPFCDPPELGIHLYRNSGRWDLASHPMNESTDTIHSINMEGSNPGTCPYLSFSRVLKRELHYPIGLLQTSLGGSPLEAWNPKEEGGLYRNMLEVVRSQGGKIRGVLWYQGCTDTNTDQRAGSYLSRFKEMAESLRQDLKAEVPFLTIQLNRNVVWQPPEEKANSDRHWGMVREAQRQAARQIPGVLVVSTLDCGLSDNIHNNSAANVALGERLAWAALEKIYEKPLGRCCPDLIQAVQQGSREVRLTFSGVSGGMAGFDVTPPFTLWDEEGEAPVSSLTSAGAEIVLHIARDIVGACRVGCCWQRDPEQMVPFDGATHLPILAFYNVTVF